MHWILLTSNDTESTHAAEVPGGALIKVSDNILSTLDVTFLADCKVIAGSCGEVGKLQPDARSTLTGRGRS